MQPEQWWDHRDSKPGPNVKSHNENPYIQHSFVAIVLNLCQIIKIPRRDDFIKDLTNNGIGGISGLLRNQDAVKDRKTNSMVVLDIVKALKNK